MATEAVVGQKLLAQRKVVIDLPVENNHIPPARRRHRLVPLCRQFQDRQPGLRQRHAVVGKDAVIVWPPVPQHNARPGAKCQAFLLIISQIAGYAAHISSGKNLYIYK